MPESKTENNTAYKIETLADFIAALEKAGELLRISEPVSPVLEISEICDRHSKSKDERGAYGGKALLFEHVEGSDFPLLINSLGSYRRMKIAFGGREFDQIADEIAELIRPRKYMTTMEKLKELPLLARAAGYMPKMVASGACQDVVLRGDQIDLYKLGVIQCWPKDSGRFITMPQCFTKNPETGVQNCGMYRLQLYDKKTTAMHIHMHHDGAFNARKYEESGGRVELACAIGGDPACAYAATAPLPPGMDEMLVAGFIRKKATRMVKCKTIDIHVPAEADIVIEGYVDINEFRSEGPFGDHTGVYSLADDFPVYHVTAITHRKNPIYQTIIVGVPPQEDYYLGKATERMFLPLLKTQMPELLDMNMPIYGNFHNFMFIQIKKEYPHHARKIMNQIWGTGQMMFSKYIVVVDENTDVQSSGAVWAQIAANVDFSQDIEIIKGPVDILDHAGEATGIGNKMGIDATSRWQAEGAARLLPGKTLQLEQSQLDSLVTQIDELIGIHQPDFSGTFRFLFVKIEKSAAFDAFKVMKQIRESEPALAECHIVAIDGASDVTDPDAVFFRWGNNVDPKRDIKFHKSANGITCLSVDATRHRPDEGYTRDWPEDIVMSDEIKGLVDEKWERLK